MAEETEVVNTEQESPTAEQPEVEDSDTGENLEQTPEPDTEVEPAPQEDKNWRAMREKMEALEKENKVLKGDVTSQIDQVKDSDVHRPFIRPQEMAQLEFKVFKAQQMIPEIDPNSEKYDSLLDTAIAGEYRAALDSYSKSLLTGRPRSLPDPVSISKKVKMEWDKRFSDTEIKAKKDLAKQKAKAVEEKQATTEAEGRSDRRTQVGTDLDDLKQRSREGQNDAIAERLKRSGL